MKTRGVVSPRLRTLARNMGRRVLHRGFAPEIATILKEYRRESNLFERVAQPTVNLSFDLEFALNGHLWRGNTVRALELGALAEAQLLPTLALLRRCEVPCNIQIATALLDREFLTDSSLPKEILNAARENPSYFYLSDAHLTALREGSHDGMTVLGVHGYTHREFTALSPVEAEGELRRSVELFTEHFGAPPQFMSFPRNSTAYEALLPHFGITSWRSGTQTMQAKHILERGAHLSPETLSPKDLRRFLKKLLEFQRTPFLTIWGHFTEGDCSYLDACIEVVRSSGFRFAVWRGEGEVR